MRKVLKVLGIVVGIVLVLVVGILISAQIKYSNRSALVFSEDPDLSLRMPLQAEWVQEGGRIAQIKGCFDCHGKDLGGFEFVKDPAAGTISGANLTPGKGSATVGYTDADWVRAIRYGLDREHKFLVFMPSEEFSHLTDEDLGKLIVYLKQVPAVDREVPQPEIGPVSKIMYLFGNMPLLFSGERIPHDFKPPEKIEPSETAEYGRYLAASCVGCHNQNYSGGTIPGVPPDWPKAANLTPKGNMAKWTIEQFKSTLRTGQTPEGKTLNPQFMPWQATAAMSDLELGALWLFFKGLPAEEMP